jgi:type I restriction enzyme R subunit
LSGKAYSASQIDFVNLIVQHLTEGGVMEPERLYESPFTDLAPQGPDGLFGSPDVEGLIAILHSVRATASPEVSVA